MILAPMLKNLKREKPWAVLKTSRRLYEEGKPWKRVNMTRAQFERLISDLPDGLIDDCYREIDANQLMAAIFGKG